MAADDKTTARRRHNLRVAIQCAEAGLYVCPAADKTPLLPDWTRADTLPADEMRAERVAKWRAKHGEQPPHVGSTSDVRAIKRLWGLYPDAVPLISAGPSGLLVLDCDRKNAGPEKIGALFREHGFSAKVCPVTVTQDGGRHIYFRNSVNHGNVEGGFTALGANVKGVGGQVIAPESIREDGRAYHSDPNYPGLLSAFASGTIPDVPEFVVRLLRQGGKKSEVQDSDESRVVAELRETDWPEADAIRDPLLGYDVERLERDDAAFAAALAAPTADTSANRLTYANSLLREWPDMPVTDYAALVTTLPAAGTPNFEYSKQQSGDASYRELAREYLKAKAYVHARPPSKGVTAAVVEDIGIPPADNLAAHRAFVRLKSDLALNLIDETTYADRRSRVVSVTRNGRMTTQERVAEIARIAGVDLADDQGDGESEERESERAKRFHVNTVADIVRKGFKPVTYLWRDLLAANTLTVVWGKDGASKTSLAINEALPHAFGFDRAGEPIERFGTLLVSLESVQDTENLIHGWLRANPQYLQYDVAPAFGHMAAVGSGLHKRDLRPGDLENAIKRRLGELESQFGVRFKTVVIDTLSMALLSDDGDETNESVNRTFTAANRILADVPGGAVVFLAHGDKDAKTFRGAASIRQSSQGFIRMERHGSAVRIEVERLKGAAAGTVFACRSDAVRMGVTDSEGREAIVFALSERKCVRNPNAGSSGEHLVAANEDESPTLPAPQDAPAETIAARKAQQALALADELSAVLTAAGKPMKLREWSEAVLAARLSGLKSRKDRAAVSAPPDKPMREAISRLVAEGRVQRSGGARATTYAAV